MAGTTIAYSEITILDLIDTATYIYYAKDEDGTGATKAPSAESKYMGIYSGPPFTGDPIKFPMDGWESGWWTGWQKYVGEDGAPGTPGTPGTPGRGILETKILFAKGNSKENHPASGWTEDIKVALSQTGNYLWTKTTVYYTDDTNEDAGYSISSLSD
jgi:hypothetical protein